MSLHRRLQGRIDQPSMASHARDPSNPATSAAAESMAPLAGPELRPVISRNKRRAHPFGGISRSQWQHQLHPPHRSASRSSPGRSPRKRRA